MADGGQSEVGMKIVATKPMDRIIGSALEQLDAVMAEARAVLTGPNLSLYSLKYDEAMRYLHGGQGPFTLLEGEAATKNELVRDLAQQVVMKYGRMLHGLTGLEAERQEFQKAFRACECPADVTMVLKRIGK